MHRRTLFAAVASVGALLSTACATSMEPTSPATAKLPPANANGEYTVDWPELGTGAERFIGIELGPDTLETCRRVSPKFPFDQTLARAQDRAELVALAGCLNHPELKDRTVTLVGRADQRGTTAYNEALGERRAVRIKELLVANGLAESRITVASAGDRGAMGDRPEYSHGYDRRVDVVVHGGVHAP